MYRERFFKLLLIFLPTLVFGYSCDDKDDGINPELPATTVVADNVFVYSPANGTKAEENIIEYIPNQRIVFKTSSSQSTTRQASTDNADIKITNFNTGEASDLFPGMCISIPPNSFIPDGALLKITDAQYGAGSVIANVEAASWNDVIKEAAIEEKVKLFDFFPETQGDIKIPVTDDVTLSIKFNKDYITRTANVTLEGEYKIGTIPGTTQQGTFKIIGSCELNPELDIRIFHKNGMGLPDVFDLRFSGEANLKLDADIAAKIDIKGEKNFRIAEIPLGAFPLGPTPIFITPTLILSLETGITGEVKIRFNIIDYKYQFDYYAGYEKGKWDKSVKIDGKQIEYDFPSFNLKASVYASLELGLYFRIMNWDGIELGIGGGIKPEAELEYKSQNDEMSAEISATAYVFGDFNLYVLYKQAFGGKVTGDLAKWTIYTFTSKYTGPDIPSGNVEDGAVINGILWATRNVDASGTFAKNPEDAGMLYQWNRRTGWPISNTVSGWDSSIPTGNTWEKANDPCPPGWRVPTRAEFESLASSGSGGIIRNGVKGYLFGTDNRIFLPDIDACLQTNGDLWSYEDNPLAGYWTNETYSASSTTAYKFQVAEQNIYSIEKRMGLSVRCVKDQQQEPDNNDDDGVEINNDDDGVEINGVIWATRNVHGNRQFVESCIMIGNIFSWYEAYDACPSGWRVPTIDEFDKLLSYGYRYIKDNERSNEGWWFGPNSQNATFEHTGKALFFPIGDWNLFGGYYTRYWSQTQQSGGGNKHLYLDSNEISTTGFSYWNMAIRLRCVKDISP